MKWLDGITDSMDMSLSQMQDMVKDKEALHVVVHGIAESDMTEQLNKPTRASVQFSSVAQSCLTLCDHMKCSTPGVPVHHHLPEFTQTHIHRVSDAIQASHPLSSPSLPAPIPPMAKVMRKEA